MRLFQEAFLEDGELHSDNTRARKFHWKNIDDDNYDMSSLRKNSDSEGEEDLTEEDEKRRLERLERQKWIHGMYRVSNMDGIDFKDLLLLHFWCQAFLSSYFLH